MDTLIFLLLLFTLYTMWKGPKRRAWILLVVSFIASALLFYHHFTAVLPISLQNSDTMTTLRIKIASAGILAICFILTGAFVIQFTGEFQCPLCILQRMAMMLCALGPAWILIRAKKGTIDARDYGYGYGISIL